MIGVERYPLVEDYWKRTDPQYVDGPDAESFETFIVRVETFLDDLSQRDEQDIIVVGHGRFM